MRRRLEAGSEGAGGSVLRIQLLGPLQVQRRGVAVDLPRSRKVRALLAYLALAPRETTRSKLAELLWDAPSDPRGELRWTLSRVRSVVDEPDCVRLQARGDSIALDLQHCQVDVVEIAQRFNDGAERLTPPGLRELAQRFTGEFLEGLEIERSPEFTQWLIAERRRLRALHAAVLAELVRRTPEDSDEQIEYLESWLKVEPFERRAHERLLAALVRRGRVRQAEEHLAATTRLFEVEGLDWISLREAWRKAKTREPPMVTIAASVSLDVVAPTAAIAAPRASICVTAFLENGARSRLGDGLADDVITRLAKLRVLFVIARGTSFALADRHLEADEVGRILNVDYVVSGSVQQQLDRLIVKMELAATQGRRIVWAEDFTHSSGEMLRSMDEIGGAIVAAVAREVETAERNRAILKPPNSLDAWEAYHRGLWHMYRFNSADNDQAEQLFRLSARLDPTFARAHAGVSFAHFQNAFLHRAAERAAHIERAYEAAGESLMADDRDPAAHWAMGRALWLRGREDEALSELTRCVELSPSFALGHYALGFVQSQSGDAQIAIDAVDHSRRLSPFDPLLFGMLASRAIAHARLGQFAEAADWAVKAAARPNAHAHILAIAAHCLAAAGRIEDARTYAAKIRSTLPHYGVEDFLLAFRLTPDAQALFRTAARSIGFV